MPQPPVQRMTACAVIASILSRLEIDRDYALHATVVYEQAGDEPLVVSGDAGVLEGRLKQRVQHVEAGLVGRKPRAHFLHAPERTHGNLAVGLTAPRAAPMLQSQQLLRCFVDERLDGVLIAQPVAAGYRVVDVLFEAVVCRDDSRGATLGGDGVTPHRVDLRHHRDRQPGIGLCNGYRRPQPGTAAANQHHVV